MAAELFQNGWWRKSYQALGFRKGYNFPPFIIFASSMFGFSLARITYLNVADHASTSFKTGAAPGEWCRYREGLALVGSTDHFGSIIPTGLFMVLQFVPIIRHKFILFHRINGYLLILLVLVSNAGALLIIRRSFGGTLPTQASMGLFIIISTLSIGMACYNIKRLQIEQHRVWMLRAMFYLGAIITTRIIMVLAAQVITAVGKYYVAMSCNEIDFIQRKLPDHSSTVYPQCTNLNMKTDGYTAVAAKFGTGKRERKHASLKLSIGMAVWIAIFLHTVVVEIFELDSSRVRRA